MTLIAIAALMIIWQVFCSKTLLHDNFETKLTLSQEFSGHLFLGLFLPVGGDLTAIEAG